MQLVNPLRTSGGLFHLSVFFFILIYYVNFFVFPDTVGFQYLVIVTF